MTREAQAAQVACFTYYTTKADPIGRNVAAGIVGVLDYESKLDPNAENNSGTDTGGVLNSKGAVGIAQWNAGRQASLLKFATAKGLNWQDLNTQLDFVLTECANDFKEVWAAIQANMPVAAFVDLFVRRYENPKSPDPEIKGAIDTATALLAMVPASAPSPSPANTPPAPAPVSDPIVAGDPEIAALGAVASILAPFPAPAQKRMFAYLTARYMP